MCTNSERAFAGYIQDRTFVLLRQGETTTYNDTNSERDDQESRKVDNTRLWSYYRL